MFNRLTLVLAFALLLIVPASTTSAATPSKHHSLFPITLVDATGVRVTIPRSPARIISLDPRDTETLFAVGAAKRMVADGGKEVEGAFCCKTRFRYPSQWPSPWGLNYPARSRTLTHIEGGYDAAHQFDVELVEEKRPNLVLSLNADPTAIQKMRGLGLKVLVLDPHSIRQVLDDISLIGRATGNIHKAGVVVANITRRLDSVRRKLAAVHSLPRVFYEIDDSTGTPYTACAGSFIDQMLSIAKAVNIAHKVQPCPAANPYPQMQTEAIVAANPQVILLGDSDYGITPASVRARTTWQSISAVKNNRIYPVDDDLISRAGPREIVGLEHVARLLHPSAFHRSG